jgi:hypothetical protein
MCGLTIRVLKVGRSEYVLSPRVDEPAGRSLLDFRLQGVALIQTPLCLVDILW